MVSSKNMNADVQRIAAVMEELTQKLTYLSVVTQEVLEGVQGNEGSRVSELLGPDILKAMTEQMRLEQLYQGSIASKDEMNAASLDADDLQEIVEQLERNTRELCRQMGNIPNAVQELRAFQESRPVNFMKFIHSLVDMQEVMLKRLTTTVEEEKANEELLEYYIQQEKVASQRRSELENQLTQIRAERERVATRSSDAIGKLSYDILELENSTKQSLAQLNSEYTKRETEQIRSFQQRSSELCNLKMHIEKYNIQLAANEREELEVLLRKKKIAEKDVEKIITAFDHELAGKMREMEAVKQRNEVDNELVTILSSKLKIIEDECERSIQESEITKAVDSINQHERTERQNAACLLQSYWRGIRQREEFVAMKKAMAKKKKKK